jgi:hypothetical protein
MECFNEYKKVNMKESKRMLENGEVEEQHMENSPTKYVQSKLGCGC